MRNVLAPLFTGTGHGSALVQRMGLNMSMDSVVQEALKYTEMEREYRNDEGREDRWKRL